MARSICSGRVLLVVDVGNTQTHFGAFDGERSSSTGASPPSATSTSDELGAALRSLLALRGLGFDDIDASIVSSTVPQLRPEWTAMARATSATRCRSSGPGVRTGMPIRIDNPRELGADRLVNAVAAYEKVGGPVVVVDLGTALTFDVVSEDGEYLGGIIAPGRRDLDGGADRARRRRSRRSTSTPPRTLIGKGTVDAIRSGVIYGFAARWTRSSAACATSWARRREAIATGGLADAIVPSARRSTTSTTAHARRAADHLGAQPGSGLSSAGSSAISAKAASPPSTSKPSNPATTPEAEQRNMPVSSADLRILEAADALFSGPSKWNRHDDRSCTPRTPLGVCSVLCSAPLSKCSAVTTIDAWRFRRFGSPSKRLRRQLSSSIGWDYNNLQTTSFQDIKAVLHVARERVAGRLASMPK